MRLYIYIYREREENILANAIIINEVDDQHKLQSNKIFKKIILKSHFH